MSQIHSSRLVIKGIKVLHLLKLYYQGQGDMDEEGVPGMAVE